MDILLIRGILRDFVCKLFYTTATVPFATRRIEGSAEREKRLNCIYVYVAYVRVYIFIYVYVLVAWQRACGRPRYRINLTFRRKTNVSRACHNKLVSERYASRCAGLFKVQVHTSDDWPTRCPFPAIEMSCGADWLHARRVVSFTRREFFSVKFRTNVLETRSIDTTISLIAIGKSLWCIALSHSRIKN